MARSTIPMSIIQEPYKTYVVPETRNGKLEFVHKAIKIIDSAFDKQVKKKSKYFNNLEEFIKKFHFKPCGEREYRYENASYYITQIFDEDAYGFSIYSIVSKRFFDDSIFKGRLPNSKFAEEVLLAIAEDYHIENLENDKIND